MKPNYYVASCSFGKDSLAMIIKIKELGLPLDEIIYAEVMFDDTLSGEMPKMAEWIPKAEQILLDKYGLKVTHLRAKKSFKEQFYTVKEKGKHIGDNYGFPYLIKAWCNSKLKVDNIKKHINQLKKNYNVKQYVGIAYDEPKRYERLDKNNFIAPLYDLKIVEKEAYEIAKEHNLLSPLYEESSRGGCCFCVKQSIKQLYKLYKNHTDLWEKLKSMEKDSHNSFKPTYTISQLEERFKREDAQMTINIGVKNEM